ncbi:MAG: hypothetical protein JXR31_02650 [Prolixibacteraceae bacterium]|nr:hypothetical protein [Prolixibacteraceae bacterium]MBN2773122.1 hypothetical protein [Prolixibacteraceae bacterium]
MLVRILKSNQAYNLILFPLAGIVLWSVNLISPEMFQFAQGEDQAILFKPILNLLIKLPLFQVILGMVLLIILGFIVQKLNSQYAFYRVRTLLPSNLIILLISGIVFMHVLHPVYFAAIFFILAIDKTFGAFEKKEINSNAFDTGIFIGLGSLFYTNMIFLFPVFILGMKIINREFTWRNLVLILLGFLLPWIFTFSYYFLIDKFYDLIKILELNLFVTNKRLPGNLPLQIYAGFWILLLILSGFVILRNFDKIKISTRKYYSVFSFLVISIVLLFFISPFVSVEILVLLAIPSSYIIGNLLLSVKSSFFGNLILFILLGLIIYMQFAGL